MMWTCNNNLRKIDISLSVIWCLPDQHSLQFVPVVSVRNRWTFGDRLCVVSLLPFPDPLICLRVTGLKEEATEHIRTGDDNCKGHGKLIFNKSKTISHNSFFNTHFGPQHLVRIDRYWPLIGRESTEELLAVSDHVSACFPLHKYQPEHHQGRMWQRLRWPAPQSGHSWRT